MKTIELIVPCHNEESCVSLFYDSVKKVFRSIKDFQFVITYVDDGSQDNTLNEIKKVIERVDEGKVQYISLSRNFGKESAMYAGLSKSTGDYVAVMDADLQHPPELLPQMIDAIEKEGYDCASARRVSRKGEPLVRSTLARAFYHFINSVTVIDLVPGSTDYRLMTRQVVNSVIALTEKERFTKGIYAWVGYKNKWIEYENVERAAGKTKWNILGLFHYAYSGFLSFATTPLRGVIYFGMIIVLLAITYAIYIIIHAWHTPGAMRNGFSTLLVVMLFLGGVIITILGMIGEYMARIYMEVKNRPIYFERESNIEEEQKEEKVMHNVEMHGDQV